MSKVWDYLVIEEASGGKGGELDIEDAKMCRNEWVKGGDIYMDCTSMLAVRRLAQECVRNVVERLANKASKNTFAMNCIKSRSCMRELEEAAKGTRSRG